MTARERRLSSGISSQFSWAFQYLVPVALKAPINGDTISICVIKRFMQGGIVLTIAFIPDYTIHKNHIAIVVERHLRMYDIRMLEIGDDDLCEGLALCDVVH